MESFSEHVSSNDSEPLLVASAPRSVDCPPLSGSVPAVVNCLEDGASTPSSVFGGVPGAVELGDSAGLQRAQGDDGDGDCGAHLGGDDGAVDGGDHLDGVDPAVAPAADPHVSTQQRFRQARPGPRHGKGGRKKGSGRRTKENFGRGLRRVLGAFLSNTPVETLARDWGVSRDAAEGALMMLQMWEDMEGKEQVWLVPGIFGVVARWGEWRRDALGECASACVWLSEDGHCRCTCVGANVHQDNHLHERPTTCQHAGTLQAAMHELSSALGVSTDDVKRQLGSKARHNVGGGDPDAGGDPMTFNVVGALYVAVCPSPCGNVPVPLYLTNTRSSCGFCSGARTRVCSHLGVAQDCGAPQAAHRATAQSTVRSLEVSAVSQLPIPLLDCVAAVRLNADVCAKTVSGGTLVVPAPSSCSFCTARGRRHDLSGSSNKVGAVACTRGFCKMEVHLAKCSSCLQRVSRDGREDHIVLLSVTAAATVAWVRSLALQASEGMSLTTCTTRWLRAVRREMVVGALPRSSPTRSGRTLRSLVLVGLKLMASDLPAALFTCVHCMDCDGRYNFVSADSIWVGFGSGADDIKFQHITEAVQENEEAVKAAYLIRGESVRRVIRDVMKPRKDVKVLARTLPASEAAVGVLLPRALPAAHIRAPTAGEKAISSLLHTVFDVGAAASKLLGSLQSALATYKTRSSVQANKRTAAAKHLATYIADVSVAKTRSPSGAAPLVVGETAPPSAPSTTEPAAPGLAAPRPLQSPPATPTTNGTGAPPSRPSPPATSPSRGAAPTPPQQPAPPTSRPSGVLAPPPRPPPPPNSRQSGAAVRPPCPRPPPTLSPKGTPTPSKRPSSSLPATTNARGVAATALPSPCEPPAQTETAGGGLSRVVRVDPDQIQARRGGRGRADGAAAKGKRRKADCGRLPFKAGKGDVNTDSTSLVGAVRELDKDARRELLSFVTAITIDSVVLPFRASHVGALRQLAAHLASADHHQKVRDLLAASTADEQLREDDERKPVADMLKELRFMELGLRAATRLHRSLPALTGALSGALVAVADAVVKFVQAWRSGPEKTVAYERRWGGRQRSQEEMAKTFQSEHPSAASGHERTGTCAPSLPQCRPEPFLWTEVLRTGMCSKHYAKAHKFSPGAMTICCGCKHPLVLAFTVLDRKEAPQVLLNMLLTRFARIPKFLVYDFACGAFRVALGKVGWLLMDCTVVSDRFHIFNHLCSDAFDPRSYSKMDGADSGAPEQRNAPIRRIQTSLQGMGVVPYTNLLAYQTAILNHEAQTKWNLGTERLAEDVDLAGEYFCRFPCPCCDEHPPSRPVRSNSSSSSDSGGAPSDSESSTQAESAAGEADSDVESGSSGRLSASIPLSTSDSGVGGTGSDGGSLGE